MAADSLKWSPISTNMGVSFFNNKLAVNIRAILDPYAMDVNGKKIDKFNIDNGGSLFRLTSAGLQTNYSFSSKSTKKDKKEAPKKDDTNSDGIFGEDMAATNKSRSTAKNENDETKSTKIFQSRIPWDLKVAYAVNYSNNLGQNEFSSHSLMFSGDLELTPKWEMGFSSGYDFKNKGFTYTQLRFNRDLNSWRMSFNWVPFGLRTTYNFFIGIKSGIMSDLKYDQQKKPDQRLF
jgi:hypothetical protein